MPTWPGERSSGHDVYDSGTDIQAAKTGRFMASVIAGARCSSLHAPICLAVAIACTAGSAHEPMPRPHDGVLADGIYVNRYFDLSYTLPTGWIEGLAGPEPSQSGYYVLNTFVPSGPFNGTMLIAAQDQFFAPKPFADAMEMAQDYSRNQSELSGVTVD